MRKMTKRVMAALLTLALMLTSVMWPEITVKAAESTTVTALNAPTDVVMFDYHQTGEGYIVNFTDNDADLTLAEGDTKVFEVYLGDVYVGSVNVSGGTIATLENKDQLSSGTQYGVTVKEVLTRTNAAGGTDTLEAASEVTNYINYNDNEILDNGISKVFVNTSRTTSDKDFDLFTNPDKTKIDAAIMVVDENGVSQVKGTDFGTINRRGNSTGGGQKKPYNIKFESKQDLFGFGKAKKWSLLANTFDKSMIRNQTGITFHNYVEENFQIHQYTSFGEVVDLYIDGYYLGTYYLLESVETGGTRVDIEDEVNEDTGIVENNEILLELDATGRDLGADAHLRKEGDTAYHTKLEKSGYYFTMNGPEGPGADGNDEETVAERNEFWDLYWDKSAYAYDYLTAFEEEISKGADSDFTKISQMIDVDSFVNYYITAELFKITDVAFSSVRHYLKITEGGVYDETTGQSYKLYAGPLWDLDLSSGNNDNTTVEQLHAQDNYWFGQLMKNPTFKDLVRQRYEELLPQIKNIYAEGGSIDTIIANSQESIEANYSVAYNVHNGDADITPVTGYGTGWEVDKVYDAGNHAYTPGEFTSGNVHGSEIVYDNHAAYVEDFRDWMEGRNSYLMKQFGAADKDAVYTEYEDMVADRFYNLALNKEVEIYKNIHQEGTIAALNDGILSEGCAPLTNADSVSAWGTENSPTYFTVDLGEVYNASDIDEIFVQYKNADQAICTVLNRPYQVLFSVSGEDGSFYEVASSESATLDENNRTIDKLALTEGLVRYVRIYYPQQAGYGMQIREVAVLDTDKNAVAVEGETVPVPTATASVPEGVYNTITGTITANANATAGTTYAIYLNGTKVKTLDAAGEFTLTDIAAGTYEVTVKATSGGWESEATAAISVTVSDDPDKVEEVTWVALNGKSKYEETAYVVDGVQNTFGNAGHRGYYAAGTTNKWQITEAFDALDVFGFVTTGANATSIVIDGTEYTSDDTNVLIGGDCVYINQELLKVPAGQAYKIFTITATGSSVGDNGTFQLKVMAEAAPDTSDVDTSEWVEITKKGTNGGRVPNTYYFSKAAYDSYVNNVIYGVYAPHTDADYHTNNVPNCTIEGNAIAFANKNDNDMLEIWVDGVKYEAGTTMFSEGGDHCEMALELFPLEEGKTETIHYVSVVGNGNKVTSFAVKVTGFAITGEVSDVEMPGNIVVDSYAKYTGKYFVAFDPSEGAVSYNIYVDGTLVKNVSGSGYYLTSEELSTFANGAHTMAVRAVDSEGLESYAATAEFEVATKGNADDIPQIYITTENGKAISGEYFAKQEGGSANVNIAIIDNSGTYDEIIDAACDIKIRGNTTAGGDKKPYNIKLSGKTKVLGMDKAKKWSLLANAFDKSLIRNALAMNLANEMGLQYNSECKFVDVYVNGSYDGSYLLIESVETGDGRVEIEAEDETTNDILLELDNNGRDEAEAYHLPRTQLGVYLMLNEPELAPSTTTDEGDLGDIALYQDKIDNTNTLITNFENALIANDYDEIDKYIDVESFAKFYIVSELFRNQDVNFSSTRFYVKDNVLYAGPCWDFDLSSGNIGQYYAGDYVDGVTYNSFLAQQMAWYTYLMNNKEFKKVVIDMYNEYQPLITATYTTYVDELMAAYGDSFERNYASKDELGAGWPIQQADTADVYSYATNGEWETYEESVTFLTDWLENRNEWLLAQWNTEDIIISEDIAVTGYQMTTTLGGVANTVGIRTIYQLEPTVEGQTVSEYGLVYALNLGDSSVTDADMVIDSENTYVATMKGTEAGALSVQMGDSTTASYYVMSMNTAGGYNQDYNVRVYAKLADGTVVYSTVSNYNVYDIALELYQNNKMSTYTAHKALYDLVIYEVDPTVVATDYNWNQTLVNKPETTDDLSITGYQMSASFNDVEGDMGLRVVYAVENSVLENATEVGLIYGLVYGDTPITADDMVLGLDNSYVVNYAATDAGKMTSQMGASNTAQYYARTMNVTGLNKTGYTVSYMVRVYAKMADGTVAYSDICTYSVNDVAEALYENTLMSTYNGHEALYTNILTKVDKTYEIVEYNWNTTLVK